MLEDIYRDTETQMQKAIDSLIRDYAGVRTGRASVGLLDGITVEYYGTQTPLNQVATLSVPESSLIVIQPWDVSVIKQVEKAILRSDLGITPSNDGKVIRLQVPPLSEERRKQLVSRIKEIAENSRVAVRNIRRDGNRKADQMKKDSKLSEDDTEKLKEEIQEATKNSETKIDEILNKKIDQIMET